MFFSNGRKGFPFPRSNGKNGYLCLRPKEKKMAHLTSEQRYTISVMLEKKISQSEIAATIGRHKSVVSREIRRNSDRRNGQYRSDLAQKKYEDRLRGC